MVDALASGASGRKAVEVRVLSWAPTHPKNSIKIKHLVYFVIFPSTFLSASHFSYRHFPTRRVDGSLL